MADLRTLLARTLQAEAGNQGLLGMIDVGSVIRNRADAGGYGSGLEGVIMKPGQFSAWNSVTGYAGGEQGQDMGFTPREDAYRAADAILSGNYEDRTGGALNYFAVLPNSPAPSWANESFRKVGGGDHYFGTADGREGAFRPDTTISTKGTPYMPPIREEVAPEGLLGMFGIEKRDESAGGQTALPFYQRDRFKDAMGRVALATQIAQGKSNPALTEAVTSAREARKATRQANRTVEWLAQQPNGAAYVQLIEAGASPAQALAAYQKGTAPVAREIREDVQGRPRYIDTGELVFPEAQIPAPKVFTQVKGSELGLSGEDADALFNVGPDKKVTRVGGGGQTINIGGSGAYGEAPEGSVWVLDAEGNHVMEDAGGGVMRPKTVQLQGTAAEQRAADIEESAAKNQAAVDRASDTIAQIDAVLQDPYLDQITGMIQGRLPPITQGGTNLNVKLEQLQGQAFLQAFESLKGGGQITEREGAAAQNAIARLQRTQSADEYRKSLRELRAITDRGRRRAMGEALPDLYAESSGGASDGFSVTGRVD